MILTNKMKNPLLSIITINFNNAEGLKRTIQSVASQSFKNFEYLVIDGYSKDNSIEVIKEYQNNIDYWVSEKDSGIYNAMNKGIKVSNGEYLLFLNSGDELNGVSALDDFINHANFEGDIIYGDYQYEEGGKLFPDQLTPLFFVRTSLPHQSTLFKRSVFDKMGLYDERYKIVSDRDFYIKCFLSNQFVFKHISYPLAVHDLSGISNDPLYKEKQALENDRMFLENYGIYYEDYKKMNLLISQLNQAKRETVSGIIKRIKYKIKKICRIR